MKRLLSMLCLLSLVTCAQAGAPDDQFVEIYNLIQQADSMRTDSRGAAEKYLQAQKLLEQLQRTSPNWNRDVVKFRLDYVNEKLEPLKAQVPAPKPSAQAAAASAPAAQTNAVASQQQLAAAAEQIRRLEANVATLQKKLKEALSIQPAAVDPGELAKAEEKIQALQKQNDLLNVSLEQAKTARTSEKSNKEKELEKQLADLKAELASANAKQEVAAAEQIQKLEARNRKLDKQLKEALSKPAPAPDNGELQKAEQKIKELQKQNELLTANLEQEKTARTSEKSNKEQELAKDLAASKKELADAQAELEKAKAVQKPVSSDKEKQLEKELNAAIKQLADAEAKQDEQLLSTQAELRKLNKLAQERDELVSQIGPLRARLAVLEAPLVPYTAEELAVMKKTRPEAPVAAAATPVNSPSPTNAVSTNAPAKRLRSMKDVPPGAGPLMAEAQRAFRMQDYARAQTKLREVLQQDPNNVYVLGHLAMAQFAASDMDACEKTVVKTLALDPDDPASLYLMGNLRLQQNKLEEALDALSRSAQINPTNAATQNALGSVLGQKGLMKQAEAALRKALQLDSEYRDAHHNLAYVYAMQKPASVELARWHYKKALDMGRPRNPDLEKLMEDAEKTQK